MFSNIKKKINNDIVLILFAYSIFFFAFWLTTFLIGKLCFNVYLNLGVQKNATAFLSDFFEIVRLGGLQDLSNNSNPGLSVLIGKMFSGLTTGLYDTNILGKTIAALLYLLPLFIICSFILYKTLIKKYELNKTVMIWISLLFSFPFMFSLERGNIVIISFCFILLFLFLYEKENKIAREISYICLAFAAGIKFYPFIFVLLLLKKKDWLGIIKSCLYLVFFIVVPFFFLPGGISNFITTYSNILKYTGLNTISGFTANTSFDGSLSSIISMAWFIFCRQDFVQIYSNNLFSIIANLCSLFILLICSFVALFSNRKSLSYLGCALGICLGAHPSFFYTSIFLFIPFIQFLIEEKNELNEKNIFIFIVFLLIFNPLYLGTLIESQTNGLLFYVPIKQFLMYFAYISLLIYAFKSSYYDFKFFLIGRRKYPNEFKWFL